jgi:hypothetical protein
MRIKRWFIMAGMVAALVLGTAGVQAQSDNNSNNDQGGRGGRFRGNFDPAQMRERMMQGIKDRLEVKDDTEWKAIQPLVEKVMELGRQVAGDRMRGMFRRPGGDRGGSDNGGDQNRTRGGLFGQPLPEADALEKAIDAKASNSELKAATAKLVEARKAKQAELEKAQNDLRKVLSIRQEAIATAAGLL